MTTTTKLKIQGQTVLVPTEMYDAVLGDAKAAGFVNLTAAESLWYELTDPADDTVYGGGIELDEWIRHLEVAE